MEGIFLGWRSPKQFSTFLGFVIHEELWRLYNALGSQVAEETLPGNVGVEQVSVAYLPAGVYYYQVVFPASGQMVASGKVVIN